VSASMADYLEGKRRFANAWESELVAGYLDWCGARWQYEPQNFILVRDDQDAPRECFAPDFYLPDFEIYFEVTAMKQSLVSRKNGKLRKLRGTYPWSDRDPPLPAGWTHWSYPDVRVEILYRRDLIELGRHYLSLRGELCEELRQAIAETPAVPGSPPGALDLFLHLTQSDRAAA
jgi:hypothetical protein